LGNPSRPAEVRDLKKKNTAGGEAEPKAKKNIFTEEKIKRNVPMNTKKKKWGQSAGGHNTHTKNTKRGQPATGQIGEPGELGEKNSKKTS